MIGFRVVVHEKVKTMVFQSKTLRSGVFVWWFIQDISRRLVEVLFCQESFQRFQGQFLEGQDGRSRNFTLKH